MESIEIRLASYSEVPAMRELAIQSYEATFAEYNTRENMDAFYRESYNLEKLQNEFHELHSALYLAIEENEIVGFLRLRKSDEVAYKIGDSTIELQRLYIHPRHQGKSIGTKLMEKAIQHAKEMTVEWIWLGVWERNFKAQQFYSKWGFERFGEHVFQMGDDPQIDWLLKRKV
jgi:diamine N-acetyltransferase